jgi:MFS family permease
VKLSASHIGLVMSTYSLASVVSRFLAPAMSRRYTPWQVLIASLGMAAGGFAVSPFFGSLPILMAVAFWLGLALGICAPMSLALIHDASPPERIGEVQGLRLALINGLQTAVPLTAGFIGAALGVGPVFWAVAVLLAAGAYAARKQWHAPRAHERQHAAGSRAS